MVRPPLLRTKAPHPAAERSVSLLAFFVASVPIPSASSLTSEHPLKCLRLPAPPPSAGDGIGSPLLPPSARPPPPPPERRGGGVAHPLDEVLELLAGGRGRPQHPHRLRVQCDALRRQLRRRRSRRGSTEPRSGTAYRGAGRNTTTKERVQINLRGEGRLTSVGFIPPPCPRMADICHAMPKRSNSLNTKKKQCSIPISLCVDFYAQ